MDNVEYFYSLVRLGDISFPGSLNTKDFPSRDRLQEEYGLFYKDIRLLPTDDDPTQDWERNFHHFASNDTAYMQIIEKLITSTRDMSLFNYGLGAQQARELFLAAFDNDTTVLWEEIIDADPENDLAAIPDMWLKNCPLIKPSSCKSFSWQVVEGIHRVAATRVMTLNNPDTLILCRRAISENMLS